MYIPIPIPMGGAEMTSEQQTQQRDYENQSLGALREAIEAGFDDDAEIRVQTDLIVIRNRPEYAELLGNR
jgi:hypothetical protein